MNKNTYISILILLFIAINSSARTDYTILGGNQEDNPAVLPMAAINTGFAVGSTTGIADVTSTGAATYQVPIQVPQGVAGLEPSISINYNSQSGIGLLGYGWNLAAFSSISTAGKTFYHDNEATAPQLTVNDNLMLDGQRLMLISGENLISGAKYRLEYDPFTDITFKTSGIDNAWFVVRTKDGITKEYGSTSDSFIGSRRESLFWLLSKVTDRNGNTITYEYEKGTNTGEFYLMKIGYATNRSIQFLYESRADKHTTYVGGVAITSNKRLKTVSTYNGQTRIKEYQFKYAFDGFYSKLTEIIENGQSNQRFNSTKVDYGNNETEKKDYYARLSENRKGNKPLFADFNGDGRTDFLSYEEKSSYTKSDVATLFLSQDNLGEVRFTKKCTLPIQPFDGVFHSLMLADLNGDGKVDVVNISKAANGTFRYNYYMFDGENFTYNVKGFNTNGKDAIVGDFNGDGKHEILVLNNQKVFNSEGTEIASGGIEDWGSVYVKDYYPNNMYVSDITGNGKANILVMNGSSGWLYELDGKSFLRLRSHNTTEIKNSYFPSFGDFNGDGKTDILIQHNTNHNDVRILFATGKGFVRQDVSNTNIRAKVLIGDFNKDGKADIFHLETVNNAVQLKVGIFNGTGFTTTHYSSLYLKPSHMSGIPYENLDYLFQVADFDGDGRSEFCFARDINQYMMHSFPDSQTLFAEKITNGLGVMTSFIYKPITNSAICTNTGNNPAFPVTGNLFPLYVVENMYQSAGGYANEIRYQYKNPRIHKQGKGFLGFSEITADHVHKNAKIVSRFGYNTAYYNTFVTEQRVTTRSGANISLSVFQNEHVYQGSKRITPYIKKQTDTDYLTGIVKTTECTQTDKWGAPTKVVTKYGSDVTETVSFTYYNSQTDNLWVFCQPLSIEKKIEKGNKSWTEKQTFEYNSKALLSKLIDYTNESKKVSEETYLYDKFGNITSSTFTPFASKNALTTTYGYSDDGVYQTKVTDPMSLVTSCTYNASGLPASTKDPLNNTTTYEYDGMGRLVKTNYPDGSSSSASFSWASPVAGSVYCVTESATGQPTVKTWFDALGREVRSSVKRFDNTELLSDKKYDSAGRISQTSLPFKSGTVSLWNTYTYDDYGRLTKLSYASGKVDTYSYSGKTTKVVKDGVSIEKTFNSKGELTSSKDDAGTITYTLRPDGLPEKIVAPGDVTTGFVYDEYGRQKEINDP